MSDLTPFPIDLDAEAIFVDGSWYTLDDLAQRIKAMLDQGNFAVVRPSTALEELTQALQSARTVAFRVPPELADGLTELATRQGVSLGHLLRDAAVKLVQADPRDPAAAPAMAEPLSSVVVSPEVTTPEGTEPVPGPGALRAAGVEEKPVELTNPKKSTDEAGAERRWFNQ